MVIFLFSSLLDFASAQDGREDEQADICGGKLKWVCVSSFFEGRKIESTYLERDVEKKNLMMRVICDMMLFLVAKEHITLTISS